MVATTPIALMIINAVSFVYILSSWPIRERESALIAHQLEHLILGIHS